jgi:ORF6N domain
VAAIVKGIEKSILVIRGERVMLDEDLAKLYGVEVRALIQAVKRNPGRFPDDFSFQLTKDEWTLLRSQTVILNAGRGTGRKYAPHAFTEQGVAMLSSVLRSERAIEANVAIMRAFVQLRAMLLTNEQLARQVAALEKKYDAQFRFVFDAIRDLMAVPEKPKRRIGF